MAATDQTYRNQLRLDLVFGVSCVLMLISVVWMFAQDYFREFKVEQRVFRDVEVAVAERQMLDLLPDESQAEAIKAGVAEVRAALEKRDAEEKEHRKALNAKYPDKVLYEANAQGLKAVLDSEVSLYNIAVEQRNQYSEGSENYKKHNKEVNEKRKLVAELQKKYDKSQRDVERINAEIDAIKAQEKESIDAAGKAEDKLKKMTENFDRFAKLVATKQWDWHDDIRRLPVLDAFASPIRIQQVTLTDLPIDYSFKYVTRFDRCMTCHQGIDRPAYNKEALIAIRGPKDKDQREEERKSLDRRLKKAIDIMEARRKELGGVQESAFDPSSIPNIARFLPLSDARINEFAAHPRLDLFVADNSPHPSEKFGCTICHAGQGTATDFYNAVHSPNSAEQKKSWVRENGWAPIHDWDFPMLPKRFQEASCIKCHHAVIDLLPDGNKVEYRSVTRVNDKGAEVKERAKIDAPGAKVVRGYNIVREFGCFGCHEISGTKDNRAVGPDLRLESTPPPDQLDPIARAKLYADPINPPGTMRRVGPSLRRVSDKTNEEWMRKWINKPREFRPDTKMPHFYHNTNNDDAALKGTGQEHFPRTEIHAVAFYLFEHSKAITAAKKMAVPKLAADFKADKVLGRQLFTQKGCLACHKHEATEKEATEGGQRIPAVVSQAHFGPNLSRLTAKLGDKPGDQKAHNWLMAWIKDPKNHSPRTYMPITHLTDEEAANVAAWLLDQKAGGGWDEVKDVEKPSLGDLRDLARAYLSKSLTSIELDEVFPPGSDKKDSDVKIDEKKLKSLLVDEDKKLAESFDAEGTMKLFIGRKAVNQLGCFGCHDVPGFEKAKPIGTALNDWGKKDPERIAFEDVIAQVRSKHFEGVPAHEMGKEHYERFFLEALEHHTREGFLQQKLRDPRSFDYERMRTWDDRLRMPQFRFARGESQPRSGETPEAAEQRAEAEAREAVMTFVLGLIAEPIPFKYLHDPGPEKLAIIKGTQVIDKFNCAGCHQLRSGSYGFGMKPTMIDNEKKIPVLEALQDGYSGAIKTEVYKQDNRFTNHNAWVGQLSTNPDLIYLHALPFQRDEEQKQLGLRLTQAVRFLPADVQKQIDEHIIPAKDADSKAVDIPAGESLGLPTDELRFEADVWGGTFADLLTPYLVTRKEPGLDDEPKARSGLPPPLLREGEKVQPDWLFRFLRNPYKIRELTILRMPRFSLSEDDAQTLANYFAAVDRLSNPRLGLESPYFPFPQREEGFLHDKAVDYRKRLKPEDIEHRIDDLKKYWKELLPEQLSTLDRQIESAKKAVEDAKKLEDAQADKTLKTPLTKARELAEKNLKGLEKLVAETKDFTLQPIEWKKNRIYATDAYRLMANNDTCLSCHVIRGQGAKTGPVLDIAHERLRPEWTGMWIASPQRLLIYPRGLHPMPQNYANGDTKFQEIFPGTALQRALAVRDALMLLPTVGNMPEDRLYRPPQGAKQP